MFLVTERNAWRNALSLSACACICFITALTVLVPRVGATTYSKAFCTTLRTTRTSLVKAGVLADMTKGPQWAKGNLETDKIDRIKRYLTIDQTLKFQCATIRKRKAKPTTRKAPKRRPAKSNQRRVKPKATRK